jgi:hypothetical protein
MDPEGIPLGGPWLVYNLEFAEVLISVFGEKGENIRFITDCREKYILAGHPRFGGIKANLVTTYEEWETLLKGKNMKFKRVLGNPPFQKDGDGDAEKHWPKFFAQGMDLLELDGKLGFVTPDSWLAGSGNIIKGHVGMLQDYFKRYELEYVKLLSPAEKDEYFKGVSSRFSAYVVRKRESKTFVTRWETPSGTQKFDIRDHNFLPPYLHPTQFSINSKTLNCKEKFPWMAVTQGGTFRKNGSDQPTATRKVKTYIRGGNLYEVVYAYFSEAVNPKVASLRKVVIPVSGSDKFMPYVDDKGIPVCLCCYIIKLKDTDTYEGANSVFNSKLFRFLIEANRTSGYIQVYVAKNLPCVDLSKTWSDTDLYKHFNLTPDEIAFIENVVK